MHHHGEVGRTFLRGYAEPLDLFWQARQRLRHAVLHFDLRFVEIGPQCEGEVSVMVPSLVACEDEYSIPCAPLIDCSSGVATVWAMTSGLAPGYCARTTTVGGTTCGYSLIGNWNTAMPPAIRNSSDNTAAMIGRSTKNWAMFFMGSTQSCEFCEATATAWAVRVPFDWGTLVA